MPLCHDSCYIDEAFASSPVAIPNAYRKYVFPTNHPSGPIFFSDASLLSSLFPNWRRKGRRLAYCLSFIIYHIITFSGSPFSGFRLRVPVAMTPLVLSTSNCPNRPPATCPAPALPTATCPLLHFTSIFYGTIRFRNCSPELHSRMMQDVYK